MGRSSLVEAQISGATSGDCMTMPARAHELAHHDIRPRTRGRVGENGDSLTPAWGREVIGACMGPPQEGDNVRWDMMRSYP